MSQLDEVMKMLDAMTEAGVSRIKVETSEAMEAGTSQKAYHHGRCDVGSPFATGKLFDLEEYPVGEEAPAAPASIQSEDILIIPRQTEPYTDR